MEEVLAVVRAEFDDTQTSAEWERYITEYANGTGRAAAYSFNVRMVKVAALAVAALESEDRKRAVADKFTS